MSTWCYSYVIQHCVLTPSDFHFLNQNVLAGAILFFWNQYSNIVRTKLSSTALRASAGRDFFFLMTLRVPLIHYVDISRRHSHKCVCTIMVINVQNQQFSASPNSSNVTNLAKRSEFCWKHGTFRPQVVILGNVPGHLGIYRRAA